MHKPITVKLANVIEHGGKSYSELIFSREMRMKDMFAMDEHQGGTSRTAALYASMASVPFEVIAELTNADMANAAQAVAAFSGKPSDNDAPIAPAPEKQTGSVDAGTI